MILPGSNAITCMHSGRAEQLAKESGGLQQDVLAQKDLIEQLELDLSSLQNLSTTNRGEAEVYGHHFLTLDVLFTADRRASQCSQSTRGIARTPSKGSLYTHSDERSCAAPAVWAYREALGKFRRSWPLERET